MKYEVEFPSGRIYYARNQQVVVSMSQEWSKLGRKKLRVRSIRHERKIV